MLFPRNLNRVVSTIVDTHVQPFSPPGPRLGCTNPILVNPRCILAPAPELFFWQYYVCRLVHPIWWRTLEAASCHTISDGSSWQRSPKPLASEWAGFGVVWEQGLIPQEFTL